MAAPSPHSPPDADPSDTGGAGEAAPGPPPAHPPRPETPDWLRALNPFGWVTRAVDAYHPASAPPLSRHNYRREIVASMFLPWIIAAVEGGVIGVIVRKYFDGVVGDGPLNYAVAVLTAAPAFANITSFVFVRLSHGRHKVRTINLIQLAIAALATGIALAPKSAAGLILVICCAVAARVGLAGVVTIRSTIWRLNYPATDRARITGRISAVQTIVIAGVGFGIGSAMEFAEWAFRLAIPMGALVSLVGIYAWSHVRVRRHRSLLRAERAQSRDDRPSFNPIRLLGLCLQDRRYGAFMACQFTIGVGNMMCFAPIVIVIQERFGLGYLGATLLTHVIPIAMIPLFVGPWAGLLDRWHIVKYRAVHTWVFVLMTTLLFVSARFEILPLLFAAAAIRGIAFAGGAIAWNLGHNDFATDENASQYMAVHVTLTGLRGLIAPFLGVTVYVTFEEMGFHGVWVFGYATNILVIGALGFVLMQQRMARAAQPDLPSADA